jgi:Amidohydrolase
MTIIDAHIHYGDPAMLSLLTELDVKLLNICITESTDPRWRDQADAYGALTRAHPDRYGWCTTFDLPHPADTDYVERVIAGLAQDFADGAIAVKIWKNIGMEVRNAVGDFVLPDDPLFDPILDFITREGRSLLCHIAEPRECWLPLDPTSVHYGYFSKNPEWHMYNKPDFPSHEQLMAARDHMVEKHPGLRVIGAHFGSLEWDVAEVAARFDRFPNFAVDTSARLGDVQRQNAHTVARFLTDYPDRVLFGTDIVMNKRLADLPPTGHAPTRTRIKDVYAAYLSYFAGLGLSEAVYRRLIFENARAWYPGL